MDSQLPQWVAKRRENFMGPLQLSAVTTALMILLHLPPVLPWTYDDFVIKYVPHCKPCTCLNLEIFILIAIRVHAADFVAQTCGTGASSPGREAW